MPIRRYHMDRRTVHRVLQTTTLVLEYWRRGIRSVQRSIQGQKSAGAGATTARLPGSLGESLSISLGGFYTLAVENLTAAVSSLEQARNSVDTRGSRTNLVTSTNQTKSLLFDVGSSLLVPKRLWDL
jgi:hypothetical protein